MVASGWRPPASALQPDHPLSCAHPFLSALWTALTLIRLPRTGQKGEMVLPSKLALTSRSVLLIIQTLIAHDGRLKAGLVSITRPSFRQMVPPTVSTLDQPP